MPKSFSFEVTRTSSAPPETLFRLETDGGRWSDWAKPLVMQSSWERWADPVGGVGAIRKIGLFPVLMYEETREYEENRRHVYTFVHNPPVNGYRGEVTFTPTASGGTELHWTGMFTEKIPGSGPFFQRSLRFVISHLSSKLVATAERVH